jgi:membrane-associated protease RseP (regulator of RpoE activity)
MDYGYSGDADRWQARRRIERRIERRLRWILVGGLVAIAILFAWETVEDRGLVPAPGIPAPFGDSQR